QARMIRYGIRTMLLFTLAAAAFAQNGPVREVVSQATVGPGQPLPTFQNGYLYFLEGASVRLYSPQGFPVLTAVLQLPNATERPTARGLAIDSDGSVAVSAAWKTETGYGAA